MRRLLEPLRRLWRDRVAGPKLRTYEDAREELGGVPWRAFNSTERWFIPSGGNTVAEAKPLTLDTSALLLTRPTLLERVKGKEKWLAGGAAACVIIVCSIALSSRSAASARPPGTQLAAAAVAAPPSIAPQPLTSSALAVPAVPPVAVAKKRSAKPAAAARGGMSPSVRSLFAGGQSSGKAAARPSKKGRRARHR